MKTIDNQIKHFLSFSPHAEIKGSAILQAVEGLGQYSKQIYDLLDIEGLSIIHPDEWYNLQKWLNVLKLVYAKYGAFTLLTLGKSVCEDFPEGETIDLETAFTLLDSGYKCNHRNGDIGWLELIEFNQETRTALLKSYSPYPPEFGKGVILGIMRKFKPDKGAVPDITIENTEIPVSYIYRISW